MLHRLAPRAVAALIGTFAFIGSVHAQGMLLPTLPGQERPLPLASQTVTVEIKDGTAITKVAQVFVNRSPRPLEATYVFPLPANAALADFSLEIGGRMQRGEVVDANRAREIYENIVRQQRDPGLLEYVDRDLFRARVFPVPANGTQRIELSFSSILKMDHGLYRYTYPLGALKSATLVDGGAVTFQATLNSKDAVQAIYSPTHKMGVSRRGDHKALVGLEGSAADLAKDLDIYYAVDQKQVGMNLITFKKDGDEHGYFLAMISPRQEGVPEIAKRVTLVIDTSGSMAGVKMDQARSALTYVIDHLTPKDQFNVVRFSTDVEALWDAPKPVNAKNLGAAKEFVKQMEALGGTAIDDALNRAIADGACSGDACDAPHMIMFITDGQPTVGETREDTILAHAHGAKENTRLFTFGVGSDLNTKLLDAMAEAQRGSSDYAKDADVEKVIAGFYDKVAHPVLADVTLELGDIGAYDVYPRRLPDLFKGGQTVVVGRYRKTGNAAVKLVGKQDGKGRAFSYDGAFPGEAKEATFLPRLWAVRKVGFLLDEIRQNGERPELRDEVAKLGKKYGIVTPYTSYLALEDERMINTGRPPPMPPMGRPMPMEERGDRRVMDMAPAPTTAAAEPAREAEFARHAFAKKAPGKGEAKMGSRGWEGGPGDDKDGRAEKAKFDETGSGGVTVSKAIGGYKNAQQAALQGETTKQAGSKNFVFAGGAWVDTEAKPSMKETKVKYLSSEYFAWLKKKPELKTAFALGEHIKVVVDGALLVVEP